MAGNGTLMQTPMTDNARRYFAPPVGKFRDAATARHQPVRRDVWYFAICCSRFLDRQTARLEQPAIRQNYAAALLSKRTALPASVSLPVPKKSIGKKRHTVYLYRLL
jgi:hypothetical protein